MEMHVANVRDILNSLEVKFGNDLREIIYDKKGRFRDYTYLYINNRLKNNPEDLASPLSDGDIVVLIPPITPNG
jgi:molybdopterin converting factor small subunit